MSTQSYAPDEPAYEPKEIRQQLPKSLDDDQKKTVIAALRNPNAVVEDLADMTNTDENVVRGALVAYGSALLSQRYTGSEDDIPDGPNLIKPFHQLTPKKQAVIDYLARNPDLEWRETPGRIIRNEIIESDHNDVDSIHETYPKIVAKDNEHLIVPRRRYLIETGELDYETDDYPTPYSMKDLVPDIDERPRELLEWLGLVVPDSNLDSLTGTSEPAQKYKCPADGCNFSSESERGVKVHQARMHKEDDDLEYSCPYRSCEYEGGSQHALNIHLGLSHGSDDSPLLDPDHDLVEDHIGESDVYFDTDSAEIGTLYHGRIIDIADTGLSVVIGGDPDQPDEAVTGRVPAEVLDRLGLSVSDFDGSADMADVVVQILEFTPDAEEDTRLSLTVEEEAEAIEEAEKEAAEAADQEPKPQGETAEDTDHDHDHQADQEAEDTEDNRIGPMTPALARLSDAIEDMQGRLEAIEQSTEASSEPATEEPTETVSEEALTIAKAIDVLRGADDVDVDIRL